MAEKIVIKRKAFTIDIPLLNQNTEVLAVNQEALIGRIIKLDLTRILRGKNLEATLIIKKENDKIFADFVSVKLTPAYIGRMIRKNISYIEDSAVYPTKDGKITIKPYLLTRKKVYRSIRNSLRLKAIETITEFVKDKTSGEVFSAILYGELQKEIAAKLKKIYPITFSEIRIAKTKS